MMQNVKFSSREYLFILLFGYILFPKLAFEKCSMKYFIFFQKTSHDTLIKPSCMSAAFVKFKTFGVY